MTRRVGYRWRLREVMAANGMFHTTDIHPHLAERGVDLSPVQVYRLVAQTPERLNLTVLAALCDILGCTAADLFEPTVDALLKTALDTTRSVAVRSAAGRAALELGPPTPDSRLATLADPALQQSGDEDELFGIGLRALLRSGTSPAAVLSRLKPAENPDLYGNYRSFLTGTLPSAFQSTQMTPAEVKESLRWVTETERQAPIRGPQLGGLAEQTAMVCDAILVVGLQMLADPTVRTGVADVIAGRAVRHLSLVRDRLTELPQMEPVARRDLLAELQARPSSTLLALRLRQAGLLGADDFVSLLGRAEALATNVEEAQQWRPWLVNAYDATRPEHLAALGNVAPDSPLFQEVARHWLSLTFNP